jgi:hypothetical protein
MKTSFRVERLNAQQPMTIRARVWSEGNDDQVGRFAAILRSIAPPTPATLTLGTTPRDSAYIQSLARQVMPEDLPEVLRRCSGENLQLAWQVDSTGPALDVICEFYDDHIEVAARPPLADRVERVLAEVSQGAA